MRGTLHLPPPTHTLVKLKKTTGNTVVFLKSQSAKFILLASYGVL